MTASFALRHPEHKRFLYFCLFVILWSFCLIAGMWMAGKSSAFFNQSLSNITSTQPSVVGFLFVSYIPIALCAVGIGLHSFSICGIVVAIVAFCRGFCCFGVYLLCGSGAWLLRSMLLLSATVSAGSMWWILLKHFLCRKPCLRKDLCVAAIVLFLFVLADRFLVSPYLIRLSMYF